MSGSKSRGDRPSHTTEPVEKIKKEVNVPDNFWAVVDDFRFNTRPSGSDNKSTIDSWLNVFDRLAKLPPNSQERINEIQYSASPGKLRPILGWSAKNIGLLIEVLIKIKHNKDISFKPDLASLVD